MEKMKNWCITKVVLVLDEEEVEGALQLLEEAGASAICAEVTEDTITLACVRDEAFAGTRKALLQQLKRTDDLLRDHREVLQRICEMYQAFSVTEVEVDYLYDPSAYGGETFSYFCFGTGSFLLFTDCWGNWRPWDGLCWDTRRIGQEVVRDMTPLSAAELQKLLSDGGTD